MMLGTIRRKTAQLLRMAVVAGLVLGGVSGCSSEKGTLEQAVATAKTGRAAATVELRKAFFAKTVTASGALDLAHEKLDQTPDAGSVQFAGAVLDFIEQVEPDIEKAGANELFWIRVGTLAGKAAAVAKKSENGSPGGGEARTLVLAGGPKWQNEAYWRQHPDHDVLASVIMFDAGEGKKAMQRLRDRADLTEEQQQILQQMEKDFRRGKGRG